MAKELIKILYNYTSKIQERVKKNKRMIINKNEKTMNYSKSSLVF